MTRKEIKGISINIRNVSKNIHEFKIILREMGTEFDFISLVETWTNEDQSDKLGIHLVNYSIIWGKNNITKTEE